MKIRTIIVEDEPLARERLRTLLERDPQIEVIAECGDGRAAIAAVRKHRPDLLFLDIQLPERNGFEVLGELAPADRPPAIIFVTAYDRFAVKAFEVHAIDYLLKPFDADRFERALQRAKDQFQRRDSASASTDAGPANTSQDEKIQELIASLQASAGSVSPREAAAARRISFKSAGRLVLVRVGEIDCVEAADNYIDIRATGQTYRVRETLGSFESKLPSTDFVRISRSAIVNSNRIKELRPCPYGEYIVVLQDGKQLTLTRGYRNTLARLREV
jgi:two-component system LytT family response regulator